MAFALAEDNKYIIKGPVIDIELPQLALGEYLFHALKELPEWKIMMTQAETGETITAGQLLQESKYMAAGFKNMGIDRGNRVALIGGNNIENNITALAISYLGGIICPINPKYKTREFERVFLVIKPDFLITEYDALPEVLIALHNLDLNIKVIVSKSDEVKLEDVYRLSMIRRIDDEFEPCVVCKPDEDLSFICLSSGSSGVQKGVGLSHHALINQSIMNDRCWMKGAMLTVAGLWWVSGLSVFIGTLTKGQPRLLIENPEPITILKAIDKYQPVSGWLHNTILSTILHHPQFDEYNLNTFLIIFLSGSPVPKSLFKLYQRRMPHCSLRLRYGLTEVGGGISFSMSSNNIHSLGYLLPNVQVKIVDEEMCSLPANQEGEILVKSPSMMTCYFGNEEATAEALCFGGWLKTGDFGFYDKKEMLYLTRKVGEIISIAGTKISFREMEEEIGSISGVLDVGITAMPADPHPLLAALIVKKLGSPLTKCEVHEFVKENMHESKALTGGVNFVTHIPRNPNGKIQRRSLLLMAKNVFEYEEPSNSKEQEVVPEKAKKISVSEERKFSKRNSSRQSESRILLKG